MADGLKAEVEEIEGAGRLEAYFSKSSYISTLLATLEICGYLPMYLGTYL